MNVFAVRVALVLAVLAPREASALAIGIVDNFEDGTTQNWLVGLLGAAHPAPPANIATGGPAGANDNFMQLTSIGGVGAGNRLAVLNLAQWAGDYTSAGIAGIRMDVRNLGNTNLSLRLYLENPMGGPPTDDALTIAQLLPAGGNWTSVFFPITPASLIALNGNIGTLLSNVTALRIVHASAAAFPPEPIAAQLGVDNITAVPAPGAGALVAVGLLGWLATRRARPLPR